MAKINNTDIYNYKELPSLVDYLIGTSFNENKKTKNFRVNSLIQLINGVNGVNNIQFLFSDGTNPDIGYDRQGVFFSNTNDGNPANFNQLILNKKAIQPIDLSGLFNFLDTIDNVIIKFENPSEPNTAFKFNVLNITEEGGHFVFDVSIFEGFSFGEFLNENIYSFYFDVVHNQNSIDTILKYGIITNENGFATIQENQFAWRLNQIDFLTSPFYSHIINPAAEGFYRTDIIVVNDSGNYQYVSGTENATEALEPPVPIGTLKAGVIQVYGDIISDPVVPVDLSGYVIKEEFDLLVERVTDLELPDAVLKTGTIVVTDLNIDIEANEFAWRLNHINYLTTPAFNVNISPTSPDYIRYDLLVGLPNANYDIKEGVEGENTADVPSPDSGTIQLAILVIQNNIIIDIIPAPVIDLTNIESRITVLENLLNVPSTGLLGEPFVIWSGEGLKYYITYPDYNIEGVLKRGGTVTRTLDPTTGMVSPEQRFDLFFLNANGVGIKTGIPDENPVVPSYNDVTEIPLSSILLNAGDVVPPGSANKTELIYNENVEWSVVKMDSGVTINPNYTGQAFRGSKSLQITNFGSGREHIVFSKPDPNAFTKTFLDFNALAFAIYLPSNVSSNMAFDIWFEKQPGSIGGSGRVTSIIDFKTGKYGYNENIKNAWQLVTIPLSSFQILDINFNSLWIRREAQDRNCLLDDVYLVSKEAIVTPPVVSEQAALTTIITDNGIARATSPNGVFEMVGSGDTSVTSENNKIVIHSESLDQITLTFTDPTIISTDTLDVSDNSQHGRHVIINNGSNAITITVNGVGLKPTTYQKEGTGTITFVAGSGRTLRTPDGSAIMNGVIGSTCALSSYGTVDNLRISNAI